MQGISDLFLDNQPQDCHKAFFLKKDKSERYYDYRCLLRSFSQNASKNHTNQIYKRRQLQAFSKFDGITGTFKSHNASTRRSSYLCQFFKYCGHLKLFHWYSRSDDSCTRTHIDVIRLMRESTNALIDIVDSAAVINFPVTLLFVCAESWTILHSAMSWHL